MVFRRAGLSPALSLLASAFALPPPPRSLTAPLPRLAGRSPTARRMSAGPAASGAGLAPLHLPRGPTRPVSCYAFLAWWLPLGQHPGCLRLPTSFPTQPALRALGRRSGLFPSPRRTLAPAVCPPRTRWAVFAVCRGPARGLRRALPATVPYPRPRQARGATQIAFGENQLSPGLIGLSPLGPAHPLALQRQWVRPSGRRYPAFGLAGPRSPGFGSARRN